MHVVNPSPNFCQICRCSYDSYIEHIADRKHSRTLAQKPGNKWILETCSDVARRDERIRKMEKETKEEDRGSRKEEKAGKRQPRGMKRVQRKLPPAKNVNRNEIPCESTWAESESHTLELSFLSQPDFILISCLMLAPLYKFECSRTNTRSHRSSVASHTATSSYTNSPTTRLKTSKNPVTHS